MFKQFLKAYFLIFLVLAVFSCQKTDKANLSNSLSEKQLQEKIAKAKAWMATQPKMIVHPLNQQLENFQVDEYGSKIPFGSLRTNGSGPGCEPVSNPSAFIDNWAITDADCNHDNYYQVTAAFEISSENVVVNDNPNDTSQHTYGRILVRNSSNVLIFSKQDIPVTITDLGIDPNNLAAHIYKVSWVSTSLATSLINISNTMRLGLYYYTECEEESRYSYAPITDWFNIGEATVCNVVSPVFLDPQGHSILGVAACSCCNPEILPALHKVVFTRSGFSDTIRLGITQVLFPSQIPQGYTYDVTYWNIGSDSCEGPHHTVSTYW